MNIIINATGSVTIVDGNNISNFIQPKSRYRIVGDELNVQIDDASFKCAITDVVLNDEAITDAAALLTKLQDVYKFFGTIG